MEHRLVLSRVWADGDHPWLPLPEKATPKISALDPLNANVIYLTVGKHLVAVDMSREEVIESCSVPHKSTGWHIPCVLPPWLGSSKIPHAGNRFIVSIAIAICYSLRFIKIVTF